MSPEYGRMEAAGTPEWFRRYEALRWSVEFMDRSATNLATPQVRPTPWLSLIARLKQNKPLEGDHVTRSIYSPSVEFQPSDSPETVQQLTWRAKDDFDRARQETLTSPDVRIDHYEIAGPDWTDLHDALLQLEAEYSQWDFDPPGLALTHPDFRPQLKSRRPPRNFGTRKRFRRSIYLWVARGLVEGSFREGDNPDLDDKWEEAWEILSRICSPGQEVAGYQPEYFVSPEVLSEFLIRAVSEEQP